MPAGTPASRRTESVKRRRGVHATGECGLALDRNSAMFSVAAGLPFSLLEGVSRLGHRRAVLSQPQSASVSTYRATIVRSMTRCARNGQSH